MIAGTLFVTRTQISAVQFSKYKIIEFDILGVFKSNTGNINSVLLYQFKRHNIIVILCLNSLFLQELLLKTL